MEHANATGLAPETTPTAVEVSTSMLEGKGPAGLYIKKAAEGKKDRGAGTSWLSPNRLHLR